MVGCSLAGELQGALLMRALKEGGRSCGAHDTGRSATARRRAEVTGGLEREHLHERVRSHPEAGRPVLPAGHRLRAPGGWGARNAVLQRRALRRQGRRAVQAGGCRCWAPHTLLVTRLGRMCVITLISVALGHMPGPVHSACAQPSILLLVSVLPEDSTECRLAAAGARFAVAFYVVMLLGAYQLMSSGLLGGVPSQRMGPPLRAAMLGGLALLLAPLLLLWLRSGALLVRQQGDSGLPSLMDEERAGLMGKPAPPLA